MLMVIQTRILLVLLLKLFVVVRLQLYPLRDLVCSTCERVVVWFEIVYFMLTLLNQSWREIIFSYPGIPHALALFQPLISLLLVTCLMILLIYYTMFHSFKSLLKIKLTTEHGNCEE
jgi:hypothetical protein